MSFEETTDHLGNAAAPDFDGEDDPRVVLAVKEYMTMMDSGTPPLLNEFLGQHAEIASVLAPCLEGLALIHRAATPPPNRSGASPHDHEFTAKPIGDFQIVGELGRGGMGVVYEAIQLSLGRRVALKVLPFASGLDAVRLQRFRNEAHAAAQLHHTNIVPVYAVGTDRGIHYYAMQLIEGQTLHWLIANMRRTNGKHAPQQEDAKLGNTIQQVASTVLSEGGAGRKRYIQTVVRMTHQAALAIEHAHQYGVVHRDIKPGNLLLDAAGKIWVTDFGLAQVLQADSHLTRSGDALGTLRYMSPEQAVGDRTILDHRTDIYSLGVTLYELLTLEPAINGEGYREMLNHVVEREPPTPLSIDPTLPVELDTIVRKAIAKTPVERYATAQAFADDLQRWLDDKPILARPPTAIERLTKWRRRNSGLVNAAAGILMIVSLGLLATTLLVWREQRYTQQALARETVERLAAEESFQQARRAVDTFSNLSETELAYRPQLQDLRRSFLETSLEFYRDFLEQRPGDSVAAQELEVTSQRVERMVEELRILDNIAPLLLLAEPPVQQELTMDYSTAGLMETAIDALQSARQSIAEKSNDDFGSSSVEMSTLLRDFEAFTAELLSDGQMNRLHQIARQQRLPFTFKTSEIVTALKLSREQRSAISRIIREERPEGLELGPPEDGPPEDGPPGRQPRKGDRRDRDGPPPKDFNGGDFNRGDFRRGDKLRPPQGSESEMPEHLERTVRRILQVLSPDQLDRWQQLIGKPFHHRLHWRFREGI